jgi:hypothetical protein
MKFRNNHSAKCLPASMIRINKSPFGADRSTCHIHKMPLRYICLAHNDENEKWCEKCELPVKCSIIDMKKRAEALKDAVRVESFFFFNDSKL